MTVRAKILLQTLLYQNKWKFGDLTKDRFLWQNTGFGTCDIKSLHNEQNILLSYAWREFE